MTLTDYYVANTGEIIANPHAVTQQITPSLRRPDAGEPPATERGAFAVLTDSGEVPLLGIIAADRPRPDTTARIVVSPTASGPVRPRGYVGKYRWTRSRAARVALAAAIAQGGAR